MYRSYKTIKELYMYPHRKLRDRTKLFAGNSNPELAAKIANYLGSQLGEITLSTFSDGEIQAEIEEHVAQHHIYIIQSTCSPTNDNLMELLVMVDAFRRSRVKSITAVIPYYGYSRQDRRPNFTRTPITSRLVADLLETAGVQNLVTIDIHSGQQKGFFKIPFIDISAAPEIIADIWKHYQDKRLKIVSPDVGGVVRARAVAKELDNADLAIIDKRRPKANESKVMNIIGDVEGYDCVMIDDLIDTAGTLCHAAQALKDAGARSVTSYASHPVFSGSALERIQKSALDEVVVTDTIPIVVPEQYPPINTDKIRTLSMGELIAETIRKMDSKQSISDIYLA